MIKKTLLVIIMFFLPLTPLLAASIVPRMETGELQVMLGSPDVIVLDARSTDAWKESKEKISGAIRAASENYRTWKETHPQKATIVLYCS